MTFNIRATLAPAEGGPRGHEAARMDGRAVEAVSGDAYAMSSAPPPDASRAATALDPRRLEAVFAECFADSYATRLEGGGDEPLYIASPDPAHAPHRIIYREDYFASALHEIAHWCLAGSARRCLDDYGYWYEPDGRTHEQQRGFEAVEARPQALEWILSDACGHAFHLSADNLEGDANPSDRFAASVARERERFESTGLPPRPARFLNALRDAYGGGDTHSERDTPTNDPR